MSAQALDLLQYLRRHTLQIFAGFSIVWVVFQIWVSVNSDPTAIHSPITPTYEETEEGNEAGSGCLVVEGIEICDAEW